MHKLATGVTGMWWGSVLNIPTGWLLCDGTHGTPNLRSKFIVAAGSGYLPGDSAGVPAHRHTLTTDGHTHTHDPDSLLLAGTARDLNKTTDVDTALTALRGNTPPYYALCYIMYKPD